MTTPATDRRVWLITGATSGFGRSLTEEVLRQGDIVVGAGRNISRLDDLKGASPDRLFPVMLDVTDGARDAEVVDETAERFGRLDVLVNGAGRTQVGALEETTDAEMRFLFDLHYFGPAALTKAALPHMRRQGGGWVVQFSSVGGQITAPGFGAYCATKFALEGLTQTLSQEVPSVHFLIVEPGAFRTGLFGRDAAYFSSPMPEYAETVGATRTYVETGGGSQPGDPAKAARVILTAMSSVKPPLRLVLGGDAIDRIRERLGDLQDELSEWEGLGRATSIDG
jgi:NAD(P)-dependent dehydrogenase (short-subunit alcohol dehydrogenase family)